MNAIDEAIKLLEREKLKQLSEDNRKAPKQSKKEQYKNTKIPLYGMWF